ncbi:MAG: hypothetical protein M3R02_26390 [Chloroflexota bacterium]|nr:hypothetical protein [Chloroflexota bacterium]
MRTDAPLHITIAAAPTATRGELGLDEEIRLVKPALLYADTVSLCSPAVSMLSMVAGIAGLSEADRLTLVESFAAAVGSQKAPGTLVGAELYRQIKAKRRGRSRQELTLMLKFELALERIWSQHLVPDVERLLASSGADQLVQALEAGLLQIDPLITDEAADTNTMVELFVSKVYGMLSDAAAYPLLDDRSGALVRAAVKEGVFQPVASARDHGKQVMIASDALGRLPAFPAATIDEMLDIRRELRLPLIRFRAAVTRLGRTVAAASYDEHVQAEVDDLYREHIAPALQEIEELVQANAYLQRLGEQVGGTLGPVVTAVVTVGVTRMADLPWVLDVAAPVAQAAAGAAWQKYGAGRLPIAQHEMFFLYRTEELLQRRGG